MWGEEWLWKDTCGTDCVFCVYYDLLSLLDASGAKCAHIGRESSSVTKNYYVWRIAHVLCLVTAGIARKMDWQSGGLPGPLFIFDFHSEKVYVDGAGV